VKPPANLPTFLNIDRDEDSVVLDCPVFVGRGHELTHLMGTLDKSSSGDGQVVFVTGEVGKRLSERANSFHSGLNCESYQLC